MTARTTAEVQFSDFNGFALPRHDKDTHIIADDLRDFGALFDSSEPRIRYVVQVPFQCSRVFPSNTLCIHRIGPCASFEIQRHATAFTDLHNSNWISSSGTGIDNHTMSNARYNGSSGQTGNGYAILEPTPTNQLMPVGRQQNAQAYSHNTQYAHSPLTPGSGFQVGAAQYSASRSSHGYPYDPYTQFTHRPPPSSLAVEENKRKTGRPRAKTHPIQDSGARVHKIAHTHKRRSSDLPASAREREAENLEIARLRVEELLEWPEIVDRMNNWRRVHGGEPSFTDAAVYGRFKRNGPGLYLKHKGKSFNPANYMHLKHHKDRMQEIGSHAASGMLRNAGSESDSDRLFVPRASATGPESTPETDSKDAEGEPDDEYMPSGNRGDEKTALPSNAPMNVLPVIERALNYVLNNTDGRNVWEEVATNLKKNSIDMSAGDAKEIFSRRKAGGAGGR